MSRSVVVVDCTFRDGGYYNEWDFPESVVSEYLTAMSACQIDVVEIGFRFLGNDGFKGPFAYSTDKFLAKISVPDGISLSVMINCSDLAATSSWSEALAKIFPARCEDSSVDIARIACHYKDLDIGFAAADWLSQMGYSVGINLMQIADRSPPEIERLAKMANDSNVNVLYVADSTGSLSNARAAEIVGSLKDLCSKPIGIHAHDNLGLGLSNSLVALEHGAEWVDATVTGMGRGPGNCRLEELVVELESLGVKAPNYLRLLNLIDSYFDPLRQECRWGTNPFYFIGGKAKIHPTYIQQMLSDPSVSTEDLLAMLEYLKSEKASMYDGSIMDGAREFFRQNSVASPRSFSMFQGRDVLILGKGASGVRHSDAIEEFIRERQPIVVVLNLENIISESLINFHIACRPVRLLADASVHKNEQWDLICPYSQLPADIQSTLDRNRVIDIGINIEPGTFGTTENGCIVPNNLVLSYALACAASGASGQIFLAGLDGYPPGDLRNQEVETSFKIFKTAFPGSEPVSITPTTYRECGRMSVYGF